MKKRLVPIVAATLFAAVLVSAQEVQPTQRDRPNRQPPTGSQPGLGTDNDKGGLSTMTALDGNWTVVSAARNGNTIDGADKLNVTIKGNVVSFTGSGGAEKQMRALRLDFGPHGMLRVHEANADGTFDRPGARPVGDRPGDRPLGRPVEPPGRERPAGRPADTGIPPVGRSTTDMAMGMTGVYVLTPDYLAVSVYDANRIGRDGTRPGLDRPGDRPGARPGDRPGAQPGTRPGGTGTNPGGTGTQPGAGSSTQPSGTGIGGTGAGQPGGTLRTEGPEMNTHISVILKRNGGNGRP